MKNIVFTDKTKAFMGIATKKNRFGVTEDSSGNMAPTADELISYIEDCAGRNGNDKAWIDIYNMQGDSAAIFDAGIQLIDPKLWRDIQKGMTVSDLIKQIERKS